MAASSRPSPSLSERTYSVISSRSSRNLASDWTQADELLAADRELFRVLTRVLGDQLHDVVVVDDGGGEEDELEVELVDLGTGRLAVPAGRALLLLEPLGGFEVNAAEGAEVVFGEDLLDLLALRVGEVGVLIELRLEALDLLEPIDELGAGVVAHEVVHA